MSEQLKSNSGRILAIGKGANEMMIRKFVDLTGKDNPNICYLPTASGDNPALVQWWKDLGPKLGFTPVVQKLFISTFDQKESFEDVLLSMDAIYVGGGNTVNMLAVWAQHGIDDILLKAAGNGILLGGGSAGGICWFEGGLTDSRPKILTPMKAMGWLDGSFAPHYLGEPGRREYYHKYILDGLLDDGYGCDDSVGMLFDDGKFVEAFGSVSDAELYRVSKVEGRIQERRLPVTPLV